MTSMLKGRKTQTKTKATEQSTDLLSTRKECEVNHVCLRLFTESD